MLHFNGKSCDSARGKCQHKDLNEVDIEGLENVILYYS